MQYNNPLFLKNVIGMPEPHARAFKTIAASQKSVIISRATGPTCHGLLQEGYDTKGYRIHGKSCNWGPMAGFVVRDPRLNKAGLAKEAFNRKKHIEALVNDKENQGWLANTTPLMITDARRQWLVEQGIITVQKKGDRWDGTASHPTGIHFKYSLIPEVNGLWGVYFDNSDSNNKFVQERGNCSVKYHKKYGNAYEPLLAMTNPVGHRLSKNASYLNAVTGDYDLFAIWPFVKNYNPAPGGDDYRPLGTTKGFTKEERSNIDHLERNFTRSGQGTKLGNITNRIYRVCQLINSIVGRQVLWHSDESARPFLDDVDLPVVAFTPKGNVFGLETIVDVKAFIALCEESGIQVTLSNAWAQTPNSQYPNRLGKEYANRVPKNTVRTIVPDWYNA